MAVAKSDGRIRLTCNYKSTDKQSTIPIFPLPVVYDLLSELGNSRGFNTTDLISGFFQCPIIKHSIPLTAVCTQDGLWEWTVMSQGFDPSPGWFQSIMLRGSEGFERVKLFIDLYDLRRFLERLARFDPKLAPNKALLDAAEILFLDTRSLQRAWALILTKSKPLKKYRCPRMLVRGDHYSEASCSNTTAQLPATKMSQIRVHPPPQAHRPRNVRRVV